MQKLLKNFQKANHENIYYYNFIWLIVCHVISKLLFNWILKFISCTNNKKQQKSKIKLWQLKYIMYQYFKNIKFLLKFLSDV